VAIARAVLVADVDPFIIGLGTLYGPSILHAILVADVGPFIIALGTLYGPSILHMLPVSLHLAAVNVF
jgi:hypothetical protein